MSVEAYVPPSEQLWDGVLGRTLPSGQDVTQLISGGVDLNLVPELEAPWEDAFEGIVRSFSILALAIDNMTDNTVPSIWVRHHPNESPIALPHCPSLDIQDEILTALIDGGADVNGGVNEDGDPLPSPLQVAIASGNDNAIDLLLKRGANRELAVPQTLPTDQPTEVHEDWLLSTYRRLVDIDDTLAIAQDALHSAAGTIHAFSQQFVNQYVDMLVANGADIRARDEEGRTALYRAARCGSHQGVTSLCSRLTADDVDRGTPDDTDDTPLCVAAWRLNLEIEWAEKPDRLVSESVRDRATRDIPHRKRSIRELLRAGADISRIPHSRRTDKPKVFQLALAEYVTVLEELPFGVMRCVNAALHPMRKMADVLTQALPKATAQQLKAVFPSFDPYRRSVAPPPLPTHAHPVAPWQDDETPFAGKGMSETAWRVASFFIDPSALEHTWHSRRPVQNVTEIGRRINAAMKVFVFRAASLEVVGNGEVVGGTRLVQQPDDDGEDGDEPGAKRAKASKPPLQYFALADRADSRPREAVHKHGRLGLKEVVHKARLDEIAKWQAELDKLHDKKAKRQDKKDKCQLPPMVKGFNTLVGNDDCHFDWGQLGYIDRTGMFRRFDGPTDPFADGDGDGGDGSGAPQGGGDGHDGGGGGGRGEGAMEEGEDADGAMDEDDSGGEEDTFRPRRPQPRDMQDPFLAYVDPPAGADHGDAEAEDADGAMDVADE
ncbi:unnamed protein product [Vitrella brassicaformis CCMP3155]|uniref:Uncharacterized protein n=4 Tax=Vitrella brassicaformis TaxID=1169539 RepID=A0A0G4EZT8_VITBC|nr:unnamed protein product [Vitrella brassicaformis CCMP3155]|eukprot:CEM04344.1 unnamed protein product [Vitrella brassicaformis CCMP3155]